MGRAMSVKVRIERAGFGATMPGTGNRGIKAMAQKLTGPTRADALRKLAGWSEVAGRDAISKKFVEWVRRACGWKVTTTANAPKGFRVHPRRWVVERTFGWLVSYRRLGKDYEVLTEASEAMIHLMLRRLPPPG